MDINENKHILQKTLRIKIASATLYITIDLYILGHLIRNQRINCLVECYNNIIMSNSDKCRDMWFIFWDISKAFDKVWHKGLRSFI